MRRYLAALAVCAGLTMPASAAPSVGGDRSPSAVPSAPGTLAYAVAAANVYALLCGSVRPEVEEFVRQTKAAAKNSPEWKRAVGDATLSITRDLAKMEKTTSTEMVARLYCASMRDAMGEPK